MVDRLEIRSDGEIRADDLTIGRVADMDPAMMWSVTGDYYSEVSAEFGTLDELKSECDELEDEVKDLSGRCDKAADKLRKLAEKEGVPEWLAGELEGIADGLQ